MMKISLQEYFSFIIKTGTLVFKGDGEYFWVKHEKLSAVRFPEFNTSKPSEEEIKRLFKKFKCLIISYTIIPENKNLANSTLYNCYKNNYDINNLSKNVRRDIRIGQLNLNYGFVDWEEIFKSGLKAFTDTRKRVGLSDDNEKNFKSRFDRFSKIPGHQAVAAWFGKELAAFMSLIMVDNSVIIQGSFSTNEHKKYCPNNALIDFILNYFLKENNYRMVCYGLSSIQENTGSEGLHQYKIRVGFEGIPVQRIFLLNPLIKPFEKPLKQILHILLKIFPRNRTVRKASGLFNFLNHNLSNIG